MSRFVVFAAIFLAAAPIGAAADLGIGVTPASIKISEVREWPYEVEMFVENFADQEAQFEIVFEKEKNADIHAVPGRFTIEGKGGRRVILTFDISAAGSKGLVKVVSKNTNEEGFTTGTGIKIPFSVVGDSEAKGTRFLAGVGSIGSAPPWIFGSGLILLSLFVLWYIADIVRTWIFSSNKQ